MLIPDLRKAVACFKDSAKYKNMILKAILLFCYKTLFLSTLKNIRQKIHVYRELLYSGLYLYICL